MADKFESYSATLDSPGEDFFSITPSNSEDLAQVTRGIYVGTSGDLAFHDRSGNSITLLNLAAGVIHGIRARRVLVTGTDATDIVGVY